MHILCLKVQQISLKSDNNANIIEHMIIKFQLSMY